MILKGSSIKEGVLSNAKRRGVKDPADARKLGAVHKVRHAIFDQFLPSPPPVTLCHTTRNPPESTSHISDPQIFNRPSIKKPGQKPPVQFLSQLYTGLFVRGFVRGSFF